MRSLCDNYNKRKRGTEQIQQNELSRIVEGLVDVEVYTLIDAVDSGG